MKKSIKAIRALALSCLVISTVVFSNVIWLSYKLPDKFLVAQGNELVLNELSAISQGENINYSKTNLANMDTGSSKTVSLNLFGVIPVKSTHVSVVNREQVIVGGNVFGIKLFTKGVIVIGTNSVQTKSGTESPFRLANIAKGDIIISVNNVEIASNEQLSDVIAKSEGKTMTVVYEREGKRLSSTLTPALSAQDGTYKCGIWVRDSSAGIGTVTYYTKDGHFGGLGHGICDSDTGGVMPIDTGLACPVNLTGLKKGKAGSPGELQGTFAAGEPYGTLSLNNPAGIYGEMPAPKNGKSVFVKLKQEVHTGSATVLCSLDNGGVKEYSINIDKVELNSEVMTKNIVISVTDPVLLEKAGGIVQGMSGSPILQDGMLVGAVTHVFVNDSAKGYGIFAENMLYYSDKLAQ